MRLTEKQKAMVESHLKLAYKFAAKYSLILSIPREDLESEALLSLCRAAISFDESRGFQFTTYAVKAMVCSFYRLLRTQRPQSSHEEAILELSEEPNQREVEVQEIIRLLKDRLSPSDFDLLYTVLGEKKSIKSLARETGEHESRIKTRLRLIKKRCASAVAWVG